LSRIGVLLVSYNNSATIAEAVTSIVGQDGIDDVSALVLADDASQDDSIRWARDAAAGRALQVLSSTSNQGAWGNLNRGLQYMSGIVDWTVLLHADDIALGGWLEALIERIERCPDDVASITTSWDMLYEGSVHQTGERHTDAVRLISGSQAAVQDTLLRGCWWKLSGAAIRGRAFQQVGEFDATVAQCADWDWTMRALARGWSFEYLPRVYTLYRQHADNLSTSALRLDLDIRDALAMLERYGQPLRGYERAGFYVKRAGYALRRMARGALRADMRRVRVSLQTLALISRHFIRQLPA
jgi:GT2 family glycosyltransferase